MKLIIISIIFALSVSYYVRAQSNEDPDPFRNYRLPSTIVPSRYSLWLLIDLDQVLFNGSVTITMDISEPTRDVTLNNKDIQVDWLSANMLDSTNQIYAVSTFTRYDDYEFTVLRFVETLPVGEYRITISFSGNIRSDLRGLYRSSYIRDGKTMYIMMQLILIISTIY